MLRGPVEQVLDEVEQPVVGAVHVLEHHHHRIELGHSLEEQPPAGEQLVASRGGVDDAEQDPEADRHELALAGVADPALEAGAELRLGLLDGGVLRNSEPMPDHLGERPIRHAVAVGEAAARVPQEPVRQLHQVVEELPAQPGLADTGGARDRDESRRGAAHRGVKQLFDQAQLGIAPDELRLEAVAVDARGDREQLGRAPQLERLGLALERVTAGVLVGDHGRGHLAGDVVDEHRPGISGCLDPRRRVDAVADDKPLVGVDEECGVAGDDPSAGMEVGRSHPVSESRHRVDDLQRRAYGPLGVVLAGDRGSPHGHHGIPDELLDRPSVSVDDPPRRVEVVAQQVAHVRGIPRSRSATCSRRDRRTGRTLSAARRTPRRGKGLTRRERRRLNARVASRAAVSPGASAVPHSEQNFCPGVVAWPHAGQDVDTARPALHAELGAGHVVGATVRTDGRSSGAHPDG